MLGMQARRVNEDGNGVDAGNRESTKFGLPRPLPTRFARKAPAAVHSLAARRPLFRFNRSPVYPIKRHEESGQGGLPRLGTVPQTSVQSTPSMPLAPEHSFCFAGEREKCSERIRRPSISWNVRPPQVQCGSSQGFSQTRGRTRQINILAWKLRLVFKMHGFRLDRMPSKTYLRYLLRSPDENPAC